MNTIEAFQGFVSLVVGIVAVGAIPWAVVVERRLTRLLTIAELEAQEPRVDVHEFDSLKERVDRLETEAA
jgi:hypothetical protein